MPLLTVTVTGKPQPQLSQEIAIVLTELTQEHLGKDPAVTAVNIHYVGEGHWYIDATELVGQGDRSFSLRICVTQGTNTKSQMAGFIAAVNSEMSALLGGVREESYIVIDEVPAFAWGYDGKTQEFRFISG